MQLMASAQPASETVPAPAPFDHVPPGPRGHFLLHFYAAVDRVIDYVQRLSLLGGEDPAESMAGFPFIAGYLDEIQRVMPEQVEAADSWAWWEAEIAAWAARADGRLPLLALAGVGVSFRSRIALLIAGLAEVDSRFGTLFAHLQAPLAHRRPCLETLGQILGSDGWALCRPLLQAGLLEATNPEAARAELALRVPALLWDVICGDGEARPAPWCTLHPPERFPPVEALLFDERLRARLANVPALAGTGGVSAIVVRATPGSERLEVLGALARALGRGLAELQLAPGRGEGDGPDEARWRVAGPLCVMTGCLPVISYDLSPGETVEPTALTGYSGPVGVLLGHEGGLRGPLAAQAISVSLPTPDAAQRLSHWRQALGGRPADDLELISQRFHLPGGYIRQAAELAMAHASLDGRERVGLADVRAACRSLNRQLLDSLASHIEAGGGWAQLVVNAATTHKLRELEQRCYHRERVLATLGPAFVGSANRGVRALFSGSSGTGKTLAARILAAELGMDLYRVDLSAVVNKYIGETEKNLHRVLSRAEELDVVLLLDEGDSLLGSRTDVKSSNDRYANLETNFLLQRLEHYQGIVLITTNASQFIDTAFQRRLDVVVNFVAPQATERRLIWQIHLPEGHAVDEAMLSEVAARCALSGGQIRNAAMHAALLALDEDAAAVGAAHLAAAVDGEYRKAGALCPLADERHGRDGHGGVGAFLGALIVS